MGMIYGINRVTINARNILVGDLKIRDHSVNLGVGGSIILK
jgi:hypothetical protein